MGNGNDLPPTYHPGNFLMKTMNPTNSGLNRVPLNEKSIKNYIIARLCC